MKKIFCFFLSLIILSLCSACDEDKKDISDVAIIVSPPNSDSVRLGSGEKVRYTVDLYTQHDFVKSIKVSSFDAVRGKVDLLDTTFVVKITTYYFDYTAPAINRDSLDIILTFEAEDNAGSQCKTTRKIALRNSMRLIDEKSGIVLRSAESGMSDAFSFANPSQTFSWQHSPDSVIADVYLVADGSYTNLSLHSNTKAKMVRVNSFDYPAATAIGVQTVFESMVRDDKITDLRVNDIILVGHGSKAEGVMMITNIVHSGTVQERCVQLSFKGVGS